MYDDEFELTFNLSDEDPAPVELPKAAAEEAAPETPEPPTPAPDEEPTIVVPELGRKPVDEPVPPEAAEAPETPAVPEEPQQPEPQPNPAAVRCVLISGGDRGIGAAAARAFYKAGYRVAVLYHTNADAAAALEQELPGCIAVQCDVASRASCEVAFRAAEQALGRVDVLVSNAGIAQQKLFTDITPDEWQHMLDVNLSGAFHLCQLALPGMIRRKAGLIGLTKALAKEEGPSGITVNCVAPGVIDTDMMDAFTAEDKAALAEETPVGRLGSADEVAKLLVFLAGEDAGYITGQVFGVNGGLVI